MAKMNLEEVREYCISLPGVEESFPFNDTALVFKAACRIFAILDLSEDERGISLKCDPELEAQIFESVPLNIWSFAKRICCLVLAVKCASSDAFVSSAARRLKTMIQDFELVEIPQSGHFVPMEQPQACACEIIAFLNRLSIAGIK